MNETLDQQRARHDKECQDALVVRLRRENRLLKIEVESLKAAYGMATNLINHLSGETIRQCVLCCKHTREPVERGAFGDYHNSCMSESLSRQEVMVDKT